MNPETGDAVKKIADDAGKSIGGSDGDAVARMSAEAGEKAAEKDIAEGKPQDAASDATKAAQAVADAGKLGGSEAAKNVATIADKAGADAAQKTDDDGKKLALGLGLGLGGAALIGAGAAIFGAFTLAGAGAATVAAGAGGTPDAISLATISAEGAVSDAASSIAEHGGTEAEVTDGADAVADVASSEGGPAASETAQAIASATADGGPEAGDAVAEAARYGGVAGAKAVANAARDAFNNLAPQGFAAAQREAVQVANASALAARDAFDAQGGTAGGDGAIRSGAKAAREVAAAFRAGGATLLSMAASGGASPDQFLAVARAINQLNRLGGVEAVSVVAELAQTAPPNAADLTATVEAMSETAQGVILRFPDASRDSIKSLMQQITETVREKLDNDFDLPFSEVVVGICCRGGRTVSTAVHGQSPATNLDCGHCDRRSEPVESQRANGRWWSSGTDRHRCRHG